MVGWPGSGAWGALRRFGALLTPSRAYIPLLLVAMSASVLLFAHSAESLHDSAHSDGVVGMDAASPVVGLEPLPLAGGEVNSDSATMGAAGACAILALLCVTTIVLSRLLSARHPVTHKSSPGNSDQRQRPALRRAFSAPFTLLTPLTLGISRV